MESVADKIAQAKLELERMIDLNPQVMLLTDREGRITRANRALLDLLGKAEYQTVLGKSMRDIFPGLCGFKEAAEDEECERIEVNIPLPGRGDRILQFIAVGDGARSDLRAIIVQDVTEDRQMAAHRKMEYKKEAVSEIAGALMHNVNQSLAVIMIRAQLMHVLLQKGLLRPDGMTKNLNDIVQEATRVADILKDIDKPVSYVTQSYPGGKKIMDIRRSAGRDGGSAEDIRACVLLESSGSALMENLMKALDMHESGASSHGKFAGECAMAIASEMGLSDEEARAVYNCGCLHDIGKLGIPDAVLGKTSPLDENEYTMMKSHTEIGYAILGSIPFLRQEAQVALLHHEREDGCGYPRGLKGEAIPLFARITSVADAFAAMVLKRPYHQPLSFDKAVQEIASCAGTQFSRQPALALKNAAKRVLK